MLYMFRVLIFDIIIVDELITDLPLPESTSKYKTQNGSFKCEDILGKFYFQNCRIL